MGCGESKHAIATENTISQSKRSNSKKNIQQKATTDDVVPSNTQEGSANAVAKHGTGNSIAKESDHTKKASADGGNVKEAEKVDQIPKKQGDQNPKAENVKENDDQPKGESVVENVKEDGNKEAAPAAEAVVNDAKEGEEKKEVKEETSIESNKEAGAKEKEDAKLPQPDEAKTGESEQKTDSNEVVEETESTEEIKTQAKKDEALEDQKEVNETGEKEAVQSAEATASANTAEEKIPIAKEGIEIESSEKEQKAN